MLRVNCLAGWCRKLGGVRNKDPDSREYQLSKFFSPFIQLILNTAPGCYGPMATMGCDPRFSPYGMSGGMGCGMAGCTPCGMTPGSPRVCSCHIAL